MNCRALLKPPSNETTFHVQPEGLYRAKKSPFLQTDRAVEPEQRGNLGIITGPPEPRPDLDARQVGDGVLPLSYEDKCPESAATK